MNIMLDESHYSVDDSPLHLINEAKHVSFCYYRCLLLISSNK